MPDLEGEAPQPEERPEEQPSDHTPEPPSEEPSGRDRLLAAMRKPSRGQAVVGVLLVAVGFASITQVRANEVDNTYAGYREQDLIDVLSGLAATTQRAETEIARLESTRQSLQSRTDSRQAAVAQAQERADTLAILAGQVPVTGPGVRITITPGEAPVDIDTMLDMVQELRAAFAEAIEINDKVRVVAQSAFEDAPNGMYVDGQLLEPPFVVDVIGEPDTLAGAMSFRAGPTESFEDDGASVQVKELGSIDITSVRTVEQPRYAQPGEGQ
jgi:uncharacterized protein YlxW (UPF0749 family)